MQRRLFLSSLVLSLALLGTLVSGSAGPVSAATPIQPGARIVSGNSACTMNFIYREVLPKQTSTNGRRDSTARRPSTSTTAAAKPRLFAGTAGHCVSGVGARVSTNDGAFGTVAFHVHNDSNDFAFIEIDREKEYLVNPRMLGFDGPSGVSSDGEAQPGDAVHVYGNGLIVGQSELTRPRTGILNHADSQYYRATLPVILGDSGGPVLHEDGSALGIVVHLSVWGDLSTLDGNTVEHALRTAAASGLNLEVVPG